MIASAYTYGCERGLPKRVRTIMEDVYVAYPDAKVEATMDGLVMRPSPFPVPRKTAVRGFTLIEGSKN